MAPVTTQV